MLFRFRRFRLHALVGRDGISAHEYGRNKGKFMSTKAAREVNILILRTGYIKSGFKES